MDVNGKKMIYYQKNPYHYKSGTGFYFKIIFIAQSGMKMLYKIIKNGYSVTL